MLVDHAAADIIYSAAFSGVGGNYLRPSIAASGIDPERLNDAGDKPSLNMFKADENKPKAWKDIWSAGQGLGAIHEIEPVAAVVARLKREYEAAVNQIGKQP